MINLKLDSKSIGLEAEIYLIAPEQFFDKHGRARNSKKRFLVYPATIWGLSFGHDTGDGHYSEDPVWLIEACEIVPEEQWGMARTFARIPADRCFATKAEAESALEMMTKGERT